MNFTNYVHVVQCKIDVWIGLCNLFIWKTNDDHQKALNRKSHTNNSVKFYFIPVFREKESKNGDGQKQQLILVTLVLQNWAMPAVNFLPYQD